MKFDSCGIEFDHSRLGKVKLIFPWKKFCKRGQGFIWVKRYNKRFWTISQAKKFHEVWKSQEWKFPNS